MVHILGTVSGINAVQVYIKEAGARIPAHQENLCVALINWNIDPGEGIWYMVPLSFAAKMEALLAKKHVYQYHSNWWPCKKDLKDHGISYQKIIQKKDDLVFVGVGSYHWVQAIGPCINVSWNIAEKSVEQLLAMALYNDHTAMQSYSPDVPLESMVLGILEKNVPTKGPTFDKLTLAVGARCLARCQLEFEFANEHKLEMKPLSQLRDWLRQLKVDASNFEKFEKDLLVPICAARGKSKVRECTRKIQGNAFVLETFESVIEVRWVNCSKNSAETRGVASLVNGFFLQVALFATSVLAMPFFLGNTRLREVLFLFEIFLNVIVLVVVLFIPETPTYLASQNRKDEKKLEEDATQSLVFFREMDEDDARLEARRIIDSYQCSQNKKQNLVTLWKCRFSARGILLGMLIMGAMAQSGITIINFYAVRILVATGLNGTNASIANSLLCLFAVAGITTAFFIVDNYGRKKLLLVTFIVFNVLKISI
ncbi:unnamed protein product [Caenorhabditis nigoni]